MAQSNSKVNSPGTGKGPTQSASPRSKREGDADPAHHKSAVKAK
jgi:hypothetical protein